MMIKIVFAALFVWLGFLEVADANSIPSSERSREAVTRIRTRIEDQLTAKGWQWGDAIFMRVFKEESVIEVWMMKRTGQYELYKSFPICRFSGGLGPKLRVGDRKTPEGFYSLRSGSFNPYSSYHLSLNIGFPNKYDRHHGRTGSYLMIHGDCVSIGCLAMTDNGIEEIYALVEAAVAAGQANVPLHIFPFRLDRFRLLRYLQFDSFGFWRELRDGYRYFEENRKPPQMDVRNGRYVILN